MGFNRRFAVRLAARLAWFAVATLAFIWLVLTGGLPVTATLAAGLMIWAGLSVWLLVQRTNIELARFVATLEHRDMTQNFARGEQGSGFDDLGRAFDNAVAALRSARAENLADTRFAGALVDGAPTPLLAIDSDGRVEMTNKAARRLFAGVNGVRIDDYAPLGAEFVEALRSSAAGQRSTRILIDGLPQRAMLAASVVDRGGSTWRIVSVQVIQHELDQAEVAAQADLVRVLTHEIMNSMTPVTSLAASAARLMAAIDDGTDEVVGDVRQAIDTLARPAEDMTHFVESYREFARAPMIEIAAFDARTWLAEVTRLFGATPAAEGVRLDVSLPATDHVMHADRALLTQLVLNLLKNAAEATADATEPARIKLSLMPLPNDHTSITIQDNGPGVPEKYREDVFLPFFTTKLRGTGVGLSFARQIILLHGGRIGLAPTERGACLEIIL